MINNTKAGFLLRLGAQILDIIISLLLFIFGYYILNQILNLLKSDIIFDIVNVIISYFIFFFLYFIILEATPLKSTLGKLIFGIEVVNLQNNKITIINSIIRNLSKLVSLLPLGLGFFWIILSKNKEAFHDILSKTKVIKKKI